MIYFKRFFYLITSFFMGKFFNDIFSVTNIIKFKNFNGTYDIHFKYIIPCYYIPIIIIFTVISYLYIYRKIIFNFQENKFTLKKIKDTIFSQEPLIHILYVEFIGFAFMLGTRYGYIFNDLYDLIQLPLFIGYLFFCFFTILTLSFIIEIIFYNKKKCAEVNNLQLFNSRKGQLALLETYLTYAHKIGITGEWGVGKTSFIDFFINNNIEKIESIYIDVSLYSDISKIINIITSKLNNLLIRNNLPSSNFFSLKNIFKEYNIFFKILSFIYSNESYEEERETLKLKLSKLNNKKIILILDNLERVHKNESSKVLNLFSFVDEFFKDTGIKTIFLFEENYLVNTLQIDKDYLDKYIEEKIILKSESIQELVSIFKDDNFSLELINFFKKVEKFKENITKYKLGSNYRSLVKDVEIENIKTDLLEFCNALINTLHNPRYLERLHNNTSAYTHNYRLEALLEYQIFTDFNRFNLKLLSHKPYFFKTIDDFYSYFYYQFYFELNSYSSLKTTNLKKITFKLLDQGRNVSLKEFIEKSITEKINSISIWKNSDFVSFIEFLDLHLTSNEAIKYLSNIQPKLPKEVFIISNYSHFYSLISKSFTEELFSSTLYKNKFKILKSAFKDSKFDSDISKINLIMAYLSNSYWFKILLKNFISLNNLTSNSYLESFNLFLTNFEYTSEEKSYDKEITFFINKLKELSKKSKTDSCDKLNNYYFSRMINTVESINSIKFIDQDITESNYTPSVEITLNDIHNLNYSFPEFSLTFITSGALFIGPINLTTLDEVKKIKTDLKNIANDLFSKQNSLIDNEILSAKIATLLIEISHFENKIKKKT